MRVVGLILCLALAACGEARPPIAVVDLACTVTSSQDVVQPGEPFQLTVVRTWDKAIEHGPWEDKALAPLVLADEHVTRRTSATQVEETRVFRAYAFSRKDVSVAAVPFVGAPISERPALRWAQSRPFRVRVRPALDSETPGDPELPSLLPREASSWPLLAGLAALAVLLVAIWRRRRRAVPRNETPQAATLDVPVQIDAGATPDETIVNAAQAVRAHIASAGLVPALQRTSPEVIAHENDSLDPIRGALATILHSADAVKYGVANPSHEQAEAVLASANDCLGPREGSTR